MNDQELFEVARELILGVMETLDQKGAEDTPLTLCAMLVPILHCAHDCSPSASEVRRLINAANRFARDLSERGEA
jgi:hypothetical protein